MYWFETFWLFLYIKNQNFEAKKNQFFYPTPPRRGVLKKWKFWKLVREPKLQNMICSTIKIRPVYKISVLYLLNQTSYSHFSLVNVMWNLHFTKGWSCSLAATTERKWKCRSGIIKMLTRYSLFTPASYFAFPSVEFLKSPSQSQMGKFSNFQYAHTCKHFIQSKTLRVSINF